ITPHLDRSAPLRPSCSFWRTRRQRGQAQLRSLMRAAVSETKEEIAMEDNPLWSRRGVLGVGVGVLGAAGLAGGGGSSTPASARALVADVADDLLDGAARVEGAW